jgi:signal peptidase II
MKSWIKPIGFLLLVIAADQISKQTIVNSFTFAEDFPIFTSWLSFTLAYNKGAAFGFMSDLSEGTRQCALAAAALLAIGWMIYLIKTEYRESELAKVCVGLVLGGAIGNVIDRIRYGHVIDFIDVHWSSWHYPAFNIADSAICIGVFLMVFFCKTATVKSS